MSLKPTHLGVEDEKGHMQIISLTEYRLGMGMFAFLMWSAGFVCGILLAYGIGTCAK